MAQDTTPALVIYPGQLVNNTYRTDFEFAFDKGFYGEVRVAFVRRGLTEYEHSPDSNLYEIHGYLYAWNGGVYTKTETATTDTPLYDKDGVATGDTWTEGMYREPKNDIISNGYVEWRGEPITENDVICIVRETQKNQPYTYPNNQKHIERALDNLSRQIQELQLTADNALKVDPSWNYTVDDENKMDPITWLQTIVRSKGLTLRELRIDNDYIEYTTDDPDSLTKTWNIIAGVKAGNGELISHFRETKVLAEDGITWVPFLEYSTDGGNSWKPAGREASELEHLYVRKDGDTMTGVLEIKRPVTGSDTTPTCVKLRNNIGGTPAELKTYNNGDLGLSGGLVSGTITPSINRGNDIGTPYSFWRRAYVTKINNGGDLEVPAVSGTIATKADVDLAANSGDQLTNKGVWYAKMYAATVAPSAEDGTNYADFSQTDGQGNPIIVLYERQNGAWVQTDTITPPAEYNGYVTVTSKIWDIVEQDGQQGGKVLWAHNTKTFTPYPQIISFEDARLTGDSTVVMPQVPTAQSIANKGYVDTTTTTAINNIVKITDIVVASGTGIITITLSASPSSVIVKTLVGGTQVAGTMTNVDQVYTFTPTNPDDILSNDWVVQAL